MSDTYYDIRTVRDQIKRSNQKTLFDLDFKRAEPNLKVNINHDNWMASCVRQVCGLAGFCEYRLYITIKDKSGDALEIIKISLIYYKGQPVDFVYFDADSLKKLVQYEIINDPSALVIIKSIKKNVLSDYTIEVHK